MNRRKLIPLNVLTVLILLLSPFFTSVAFGEESNKSLVSDSIVKQGEELLIEERQKLANELKDELGYGEMYNGQSKAYQPNDKVRVIIEVAQPKKPKSTSVEDQKLQMKNVQDKVIQSIEKTRSKSELRHRFYEGVNGFSMETEFKSLKQIAAQPDVVDVHIAKTFEHAMNSSKESVQAPETWEKYGLKGEGLLVAVVDSGLDYTHQDMTLSKNGKDQAKWTESSIQPILDETEVNDKWYSDKVPSGYDWADMNDDVIPKGDSHGMHVAGIVGANGDEESGGVAGVAPDVQLLAEKVFSDHDGAAYEDDIIAGIEHAVELKADVINLSLGSDGDFVGEIDDPVQKTIRQATEKGTLVVAAAGNAYYSTKNNLLETAQKPYASNPDIGVVGAPGVSPFALSVASYENDQIHYNTLKLSDGNQLPYADQTQFGFKLQHALDENTPYDLVYGGEGRDTDLKDIDVDGKVILIQPDQPYANYSYAQFAAEREGALAVIMVPPTPMEDFPLLSLSDFSIPLATTNKEAGNQVIEKLEKGEHISIQLADDVWLENPNKQEMSDFSSIGAPHTLDFKPEISAPGGNIYSTVGDNEYEVMSGTSMASPNVAGGASLVLQSLYEKGLDQTEDSALQAKLALMNTSKIVNQPGTDIPYSPRKQGAGLMQISDAIQTPVLVSDKNAPLEEGGSVALKEIKGNTAQFLLDIEALSDEKVEYDVYVDVLTDERETLEFDLTQDGNIDESHDYLTLNSERVEGAMVMVNGSITSHDIGSKVLVTPNNNVKLYVNIFLPSNMDKNSFVEGYVRLVPKDAEQSPELTIPYMGFHGDWDTQPNIDPSPWEDDAFLGFTVLWDDMSDLPLGYNLETDDFDLEKIAISSLSGAPGVYSTFTALRNLEKTEMYIENEKGEKIFELGNFSEDTGTPWKFPKNILVYEDNYYGGYLWEVADDEGNFVADGDYQYVIESTLDYEGADPQVQKMPIKIDSVPPTVSDIKVNPKDGNYEISFKAEDNKNGSGYYGALLYIDGWYTPLDPGENSIVVDDEPESVIVMAQDYAYNTSFEIWGDPSYVDDSMLVSWFTAYGTEAVSEDSPLEVVGYASNRLDWTVIIEDNEGNQIDSFTENRQHSLRTTWTPDSDVSEGQYNVYATAENIEGFKVTTEKISFKVVNEQ